jgi:hypothetical protein
MPWRATCSPPLLGNCTVLNITAQWAMACFIPRYHALQRVYGTDYERLASAIAREEAPDCPFPPTTGAAYEYQRRIHLAVAILLNMQGQAVPLPDPSVSPRPPTANLIALPWMRALLTGWT